MTQRTKNHLTNGVICLMLAYVALLPYFHLIYNKVNRFVLQWSLITHAAILTAIFILSAGYFLVYLIGYLTTRKSKKLTALALMGVSWILYFIMVRSTINIMNAAGVIPESVLDIIGLTLVKMGYYFVLPAPFILFANKIFGTVLQKLYLVLSPIIIMLIGAPLFWTNQAPTFSEFEIENDVSATTNTLPSILVIIFDEWDYEVTFPNNQLLDGLPNLRALLDESTLYSKALSAGATTATAIPRFLFQRNPDFLKKSYDEIYDDLYSRRTIEGPSFFKAFDDRYTRAIIGYYLNYPRLLGEDVDFARTMPVGGTLPYWEHMVELLKSQTAILRFVGIHVEEKKLRGEEVLFWNLVEPVHELTTNIIANSTKPVVGIFHYPVPHDPFIYDANGKKTTVDSTQDLSEALRDRQGYLDNLAYLDTLLGQLIQVLKDQGRYEHTLFVATSDHSWRLNADKGVYIAAHEDKKPDSKFKHVPLIIHEPGQTEGRLVDEPFPLVNFYNYLEAYLERTYPDAIQK